MEKNFILEKLDELAQKDGFKEAIDKASTKEDTVKVLSEYGWTISLTEFEDVLDIVVPTDNGELSVADLENVSGGGVLLGIGGVIVLAWMVKGFKKGIACD